MRALATALAFTLAAAGCGESGDGGEAPPAPPRFPAAPNISVPEGFRAEIYARGLSRPTAMAFGQDGRLYVAQLDGKIVVALPNAKRARPFADGFSVPLGLAWREDVLYVSAQGELWSLGAQGKERTAIVSGLPHGVHQQDAVVLGPDDRLYFGSGSTCNACEEEDPRSATVLSVKPDGSDLQIVATGIRNPFGLAFEPETGRLWASVNGRDDLGADNPAESVVRVKQGADYGWPDCWPNWQTGQMDGDCEGVTRHDVFLEPRSSADGLAFWNGDVFVAEWGANELKERGRKVVRIDPETLQAASFADGFQRPLALAVDRWNGLLVADWARGIIYRIQAAGEP
jgi:glucose/arabinose dehydrogenase